MNSEDRKWPLWLALVVRVLVAWALLAFFVIIEVEPSTSMSVVGWVLLIVFGPPVYLALEVTADHVFGDGKTSLAEIVRALTE